MQKAVSSNFGAPYQGSLGHSEVSSFPFPKYCDFEEQCTHIDHESLVQMLRMNSIPGSGEASGEAHLIYRSHKWQNVE
jgi:hypothetical protein